MKNGRWTKDRAEQRAWLQNMVGYHRFSVAEIGQATGLEDVEVRRLLREYKIAEGAPESLAKNRILVLPYPGGRHPRIGFRDGAIDPQRETKVSVFLPWEGFNYVVLDVPEAIWWKVGERRELLYLAHTHIPTTWTRKNLTLEPLEWRRGQAGELHVERRLPNGVVFGTRILPASNCVRMTMWLTNGTREKLSGLQVQNCVMLRGAPQWAQQTNENKRLIGPYAACSDEPGTRWVVTGWKPNDRVWANPPCPCMHSDPRFPDCDPGQTAQLSGWLSFYEGEAIEREIARIDRLQWWHKTPPIGEPKVDDSSGRERR